MGRITFIPIDKIHTYGINDDNVAPLRELKDHVYPIINVLKYDASLRIVMLHVFGNTLLCKDIDTAIMASKKDYNCVTLDGDEVN